MSTETEATSEISEAGSHTRKSKLILILGAAAAMSLLGGGVWFSGMLSRPHKPKSIDSIVTTQPVFVETPEMVTNLDAGPHRLSFVKVQCKIEVSHPRDAASLTAVMPRLVDMIQTYLRETRPEELRSDTGTYRLREALLLRASLATSDATIKDVLFEELIVQ